MTTDGSTRDRLREAIARMAYAPEPDRVAALLPEARMPPAAAQRAGELALRLARELRDGLAGARVRRAGQVQALLQEFTLGSAEGVALMCLSEALLRIPDAATRDALIRDKLRGRDWRAHVGHGDSLFVDAVAWGLALTGRVLSADARAGLGAALDGALRRGGEPLIRRAMDFAIRMLGEQFVAGRTIEEALAGAREREAMGFRFSYDMLGEAAVTTPDALRYLDAYAAAIEAIGAIPGRAGVRAGPGISVKLSALHPRYARSQQDRVHAELYPRLLGLVELARGRDIGVNIDAEESERLELSLSLLERLCFEPSLAGWDGIGFVVQAYQRRSPEVIDFLVDLARRSGHRLMIRLVKGAYWDAEIKRTQLEGLHDYPVFTRKPHTDVAYLACARRLLSAGRAVYPQFATHNAMTLAAVHEMASAGTGTGADAYADADADAYEFQCLHGMGEPLYERVVAAPSEGGLGRPCRIYAPVGSYETLLAYLVRRLLENGANVSFVNRIADPSIAIEAVVADPVDIVDAAARSEGVCGLPHPAIVAPPRLYGTRRRNSSGRDLADEAAIDRIALAIRRDAANRHSAAPMLARTRDAGSRTVREVRNPADRADCIGHVEEASPEDIEAAIAAADRAASPWMPAAQRADVLERAADLLEADLEALVAIAVREAGKSWANGVGEVREAVDFLRYYAYHARTHLDSSDCRPLGTVVCISPWNFPLAIFVGQVAAALAAGNAVLAKPAEQTPLIAARAVEILLRAGVPRDALQLLPGEGATVGAALVRDARIQGVLFTGSTEVARQLQGVLAQRLDRSGRPVTLVAETGGQNAMLVDSSALAEQAVADVLQSAFDSAGQRCSALRVLCLQQDVADDVLEMLVGATAELRLGDPRMLATDVGPVIDEPARAAIERHVERMRAEGYRVRVPKPVDAGLAARGSFVAPTIVEIPSIDVLRGEVFGPVLHVLRYRRADVVQVLDRIRATGYGLTMGIHSRIDETVAAIASGAVAGNLYVNRNMVGAVVGVQPFGGEGLSGTGPKAGGPLYLPRLLSEHPASLVRTMVRASDVAAPAVAADGVPARLLDAVRQQRAADPLSESAMQSLVQWASARGDAPLLAACERYLDERIEPRWIRLAGPTGESDLYTVLPRGPVLCMAQTESDLNRQVAAALAVGARPVLAREAPGALAAIAARCLEWLSGLPAPLAQCLRVIDDPLDASATIGAVLVHGDPETVRHCCELVVQRQGPIVPVIGMRTGETGVPLERLLVERSLSINTAAAGGNATLMSSL